MLAENDPALLLVQRIRDEAHRFAVTFHRKARSMRDLRSELDDVPGIGPRRRRALLTAFGSLAGVRRATREELDAVVGAEGGGRGDRLLRARLTGDSKNKISWYSRDYHLQPIDLNQVLDNGFTVLIVSLAVHKKQSSRVVGGPSGGSDGGTAARSHVGGIRRSTSIRSARFSFRSYRCSAGVP